MSDNSIWLMVIYEKKRGGGYGNREMTVENSSVELDK